MEQNKREDGKTLEERLAEMIDKVPDDKKEVVAAHLIGTVQGVLIAADMQRVATA